MKTRQISVTIIDQNNDSPTTNVSFTFKKVEDLDEMIDCFIKEELNLRKVEVNIEDYSDILTNEEIEFLEEKNYYLI